MGALSLRQAMHEIDDLASLENDKRGLNIPVVPDKKSNDGFIYFSVKQTPEEIRNHSAISIGVRSMYTSAYYMPFLAVDNETVVTGDTSVWHEFDHADLLLFQAVKPDADEYIKQLARSEIIAEAADDHKPTRPYYSKYYSVLPYEQRAFLVSGEKSVEFFRQKHPDIPAEMILMDWYIRTGFYPYQNTGRFDEVLNYMSDQKERIPYKKRPVDLDHPSPVFARFCELPRFRQEYLNAPNGVEMDKVAVKYLAVYAKEYLRAFPCIQKDLGITFGKSSDYGTSRGNLAMERFGDIVAKSDAGKDIEYGDD